MHSYPYYIFRKLMTLLKFTSNFAWNFTSTVQESTHSKVYVKFHIKVCKKVSIKAGTKVHINVCRKVCVEIGTKFDTKSLCCQVTQLFAGHIEDHCFWHKLSPIALHHPATQVILKFVATCYPIHYSTSICWHLTIFVIHSNTCNLTGVNIIT